MAAVKPRVKVPKKATLFLRIQLPWNAMFLISVSGMICNLFLMINVQNVMEEITR